MGIRFIFLPANSTHLTQPLDVSVFRPLKVSWRKKLLDWKKLKKGSLDKSLFPGKLNNSIGCTVGMTQNIVSGFRATDIVPLDRHQVLKRLPESEIQSEIDVAHHILTPVIDLLKMNRFGAGNATRQGRKWKINTPAGRAV